MRAWVSPARSLVTAVPTFENCTGYAKRYELPVTEVKVDSAMRIDVGALIAAASTGDAGLVFFNNPNNPTATVHGATTVTDMVERIRKTEVRAFTVKALQDMGAKPSDSQGNFIFVDIGRPAKEFREPCAKSGVMVGRDFPPFEKTHCRISIGTMEEMKKATEVFRSALTLTTTAAGEQGGR